MTENEHVSNDGMRTFSDSEIRTIALAIIAGLVFGGVATGVAFPTLPLLDELLGISAVMLGLILSANRFSRLPLNAPAGNLIDNVGARRPMILGLFTQALAPFGYIVGLNAPPATIDGVFVLGSVSAPGVIFLISRMLWGVGSAFVFLGAFATITYVTTDQNRGRWLGYMRGGQSVGFPSGLVIGGTLFDLVGAQAAFMVAGVLALSAGIIATVVLPRVKPETEERARLRDMPAMIRREPRIFPIGIGNMTIRFIFGGVLLATVARYASTNNMELAMFGAAGISGVVLAVGVVTSGTTTVISGRLSDNVSNRIFVAIPPFISMTAGLLLLAFVPRLEVLFLATAMIGVGSGGIGPALLALVGDLSPGDEVGRMGSVYNIMGDVGSTAGPLLAVPMVDSWFGFQVSYVSYAIGVALTAIVVTVPLLRWNVARSDPSDVTDV